MAFLGIRIPHETGRLLSKIEVPGEKTSTSEMHITLLYLGDEWPISEISKAMEAAFDIVSKTKPFTAEMNKVSHFPKNPHDQDKYPIITRVESKELHELREPRSSIKMVLSSLNFILSTNHTLRCLIQKMNRMMLVLIRWSS
jgi:2'-5' RNA ligase